MSRCLICEAAHKPGVRVPILLGITTAAIALFERHAYPWRTSSSFAENFCPRHVEAFACVGEFHHLSPPDERDRERDENAEEVPRWV